MTMRMGTVPFFPTYSGDMIRFIALLAACCVQAAHAGDLRRDVDAIMAPWTGDVPGVVVAVVSAGHVALARAYGMADLGAAARMRLESRFPLDSITKQFTGAAIVMLQQRGMLRYGDELAKFVPEVRAPGITLRDLLRHASGLPDLTERLPPGASLDDIVKAYAALDVRDAASHKRYAYNNTGYALLAAVVERASHRPYARFVREELLRPAGMASTDFADGSPLAGAVRTYRNGEPFEAPIRDQPIGGGGLVTVAADIARWYEALDEGRLLPGYAAAIETLSSASSASAHAPTYAAGWVVGRSGSLERWSHGGSWRGSKNYVLRYPQRKLTVVLLSNAYEFGERRHAIAYRIARLFIPELEVAGEPAGRARDGCIEYALKRAANGRVVIDGADDIAVWKKGGTWMRDPWPYGSDPLPAALAHC